MSHAKPATTFGPVFDFSTDDAPLDLTLVRNKPPPPRSRRRRNSPRSISRPSNSPTPSARSSATAASASATTPLSSPAACKASPPLPIPCSSTPASPSSKPATPASPFTPRSRSAWTGSSPSSSPVVQRREGAALRAAILAGHYAPTLADARQIYPGRKINTLVDSASRATLFVPERFADPDLEAEAVQVIQNAFHLAQVTGKRSHLEAALDDEAVRQVSRIPGNLASTVFGQRLAELNAPARDRQLDGSANSAAMSPAVRSEAQPATQSVVPAPSPADSLQRNPPQNETGSAARPFELPMTRAEARRRYGEILPASDRVGPPLPVTVKNVAAVTADAIAKTAVGLATIGNFADPPRGNLREIGTGFGIARTAAGEALGVDVNNPRFGVASDLLPLGLVAAARRRGSQTQPPAVYRMERAPQAHDRAQVNQRPHDVRPLSTPEQESLGISTYQHSDRLVKRVGTNSDEITEVLLDDIKPIHPVPRPGKPDGYIETLAKGIVVDGFDLRHAVNIVAMPNGLKVSFGGHHRIVAMKELKQATIIPAKVVNWVDMSPGAQQAWLKRFPNISDYLK